METNRKYAFWILFGLILLTGAALRTYRMDMPPIDFPADRQNTNIRTIQALRQGEPLFSLRNPFMELRLYSWINARTAFLCRLFHCEIWTLARFWSVFFGILTIAMAALAGYWAAAAPGAPPGQPRRLALLLMAAIAFNPYHGQLARVIATESFTLAMQMCALAFFWIAWRKPEKQLAFAAFGIFFVFSGWAKLPSLIWMPAFAIYIAARLLTRAGSRRIRLIALGVFVAGLIAIFWFGRINPFRIFAQYAKNYPYFAAHTHVWLGSALWTRTFLSRIVLMLTLPGTLLALLGFLAAPWLFRITVLVFLVVFYRLVNLNTYNFCHIIIPGMALAAWGAHRLIEAASGENPIAFPASWGKGLDPWSRRLNQALGAGLCLFLIFWLYPLGPDGRWTPQPRGDILQALQVVKKLVPPQTWVYHDDGGNTFGYMNGQNDTTVSVDTLDLRTGYYFLFERFTERPLHDASNAWVKWASLPQEAGGMLLTRARGAPPSPEKSPFVPIVAQPAQEAGDPPLRAETCYLPAARYDAARQTLRIRPPATFTLGVAWSNPRRVPLAGVRWQSARWGGPIAIPLREGGFAIAKGGVLCVPEETTSTVYYTFEIPPNFPPGGYTMDYYPLNPGPWREPEDPPPVMPFKIVIDSPAAPSGVIDLPFRALWPVQYTAGPLLWSEDWFYRRMRPEGFSFSGAINTFVLSCPLQPAGDYEITLRGQGRPLAGHTDPQALWPAVYVYLPADLQASVAKVVLDSRDTGEFTAALTAPQPFDGLMLRAVADFGETAPRWITGFNPQKYGKQTLDLRSVRLSPRQPPN